MFKNYVYRTRFPRDTSLSCGGADLHRRFPLPAGTTQQPSASDGPAPSWPPSTTCRVCPPQRPTSQPATWATGSSRSCCAWISGIRAARSTTYGDANQMGAVNPVSASQTPHLLHGRMSPSGYKQTLAGLKTTSASPPGADVPGGVSKGLLLTRSGRSLDHSVRTSRCPAVRDC